MLCVNNLSRFPQPVELDLSEHGGHVPVELTGGVRFPAIGELPYLLTLPGPRFLLVPARRGRRRRDEVNPRVTDPDELVEELVASLPIGSAARWFGGKASRYGRPSTEDDGGETAIWCT